MFNFASETQNNVQVLRHTGFSWQAWSKPRGVSVFTFILIGGGGAGGAGRSTAAGTNRSGGAGGACSAISILTIHSDLLPDTLFFRIGQGGATAAADGSISAISVVPDDSVLTSIVLMNSAFGSQGAGGGGTGNGSGASGGGAGAVFAGGRYTSLGSFSSIAGIVGASSDLDAGTDITPSSLTFLTPGASGGGTPVANTEFAGGAILASGIYAAIPGGLASGGAGNPGLFIRYPFTATGGTGGGSSGTGTGGAGGNGGYGCGGGGGGGGVTGGAAGRGGDGIGWIISH